MNASPRQPLAGKETPSLSLSPFKRLSSGDHLDDDDFFSRPMSRLIDTSSSSSTPVG